MNFGKISSTRKYMLSPDWDSMQTPQETQLARQVAKISEKIFKEKLDVCVTVSDDGFSHISDDVKPMKLFLGLPSLLQISPNEIPSKLMKHGETEQFKTWIQKYFDSEIYIDSGSMEKLDFFRSLWQKPHIFPRVQNFIFAQYVGHFHSTTLKGKTMAYKPALFGRNELVGSFRKELLGISLGAVIGAYLSPVYIAWVVGIAIGIISARIFAYRKSNAEILERDLTALKTTKDIEAVRVFFQALAKSESMSFIAPLIGASANRRLELLEKYAKEQHLQYDPSFEVPISKISRGPAFSGVALFGLIVGGLLFSGQIHYMYAFLRWKLGGFGAQNLSGATKAVEKATVIAKTALEGCILSKKDPSFTQDAFNIFKCFEEFSPIGITCKYVKDFFRNHAIAVHPDKLGIDHQEAYQKFSSGFDLLKRDYCA